MLHLIDAVVTKLKRFHDRCPASVSGRASSIKMIRISSIDLRELFLLGKSCHLASRRW